VANSYHLKQVDYLFDRYAIYTADLSEQIYLIRKKYGKHIKDPELGIYWVDKIKPIVKITDRVYRQSDYEKQLCFDIKLLDSLDEPLLDKDANTLLPKGIVDNKDIFLKLEPNLDARAIEIITIVVKNYISSLVLHNAYETPLAELKNHLKESGHYLIEKGVLQEACLPLLEDIDYFVGHHQWNIYMTEIESIRLHVSRCIDYRIMDWTQRMASGEWKEQTG